jgi:heme exporter protein C
MKIYGLALLPLFAVGVYLALAYSPPDAEQGDLIRIMYAHVSVAWICFVAVGLTALFGALYLWRGKKSDDILAVAFAEAGVFFGGLTLIGGMTYSRPTFNAFWTWDAKLTATALLFALLIGYFIVRNLIDDPQRRGRVSAVIGLITLADVPIIYFAANWWRTLHPELAIRADVGQVNMAPGMLLALLYNVGVAALIFIYLMIERTRIGRLEAELQDELEPQPTVSGEVIHV